MATDNSQSPAECHNVSVKAESCKSDKKAIKINPAKSVASAVKMYLLPSSLPVDEKPEKVTISQSDYPESECSHRSQTGSILKSLWTALPYILIGFFAGVALHFILEWNRSAVSDSHVQASVDKLLAQRLISSSTVEQVPEKPALGDNEGSVAQQEPRAPHPVMSLHVHSASALPSLAQLLDKLTRNDLGSSTDSGDDREVLDEIEDVITNSPQQTPVAFNQISSSEVEEDIGVPPVKSPLVSTIGQMINELMAPDMMTSPMMMNDARPLVGGASSPILIRRIVRVLPDMSAERAVESSVNPLDNIIKQMFNIEDKIRSGPPSQEFRSPEMMPQQARDLFPPPQIMFGGQHKVVPLGGVKPDSARVTVLRLGPFASQQNEGPTPPFVRDQVQQMTSNIDHLRFHQPSFSEQKRNFFSGNKMLDGQFAGERSRPDMFHERPVMKFHRQIVPAMMNSQHVRHSQNDFHHALPQVIRLAGVFHRENMLNFNNDHEERDEYDMAPSVSHVTGQFEWTAPVTHDNNNDNNNNNVQQSAPSLHVPYHNIHQQDGVVGSSMKPVNTWSSDNIQQNNNIDYYNDEINNYTPYQQQPGFAQPSVDEYTSDSYPVPLIPTTQEFLPVPQSVVPGEYKEQAEEAKSADSSDGLRRLFSPLKLFGLGSLLHIPDMPRDNSPADLSAAVFEHDNNEEPQQPGQFESEQPEENGGGDASQVWGGVADLKMEHRGLPPPLINPYEVADTPSADDNQKQNSDKNDDQSLDLYESVLAEMRAAYSEEEEQQQDVTQNEGEEEGTVDVPVGEDVTVQDPPAVILQMSAENSADGGEFENFMMPGDMLPLQNNEQINDDGDESVVVMASSENKMSETKSEDGKNAMIDVDTELEAVE